MLYTTKNEHHNDIEDEADNMVTSVRKTDVTEPNAERPKAGPVVKDPSAPSAPKTMSEAQRNRFTNSSDGLLKDTTTLLDLLKTVEGSCA